MSDDREWCHCEQVTSTCAKCGGKDAYRKSPLRLSGDQLSLNGAAGVTRRMKPEEKIKHLEQQLSTTKAELTKTKEHLAIEESECVRLCNEKNRFKAELQAEKAKAALDEISEIGQEMSLNSLKHDAVIEASLFIRSRITMNNIHCDDRSIGKRDILSLLDEYAESMQ